MHAPLVTNLRQLHGNHLVFKGPYEAVLIDYPNYATKDELVRSALHS